LNLCRFLCVCMWFIFLYFFASARADISYLFFNLPRLRA
jgi:hypothetical protein